MDQKTKNRIVAPVKFNKPSAQTTIKNKLVISVTSALIRYSQCSETLAGIHLIGYVKKGLLKSRSATDTDLLHNLSGPFPITQNFYIFLRKAKCGDFLADKEAIARLFKPDPHMGQSLT